MLRIWLDPGIPIAGSDFPPFSESVIRGGAFGWPHLWTDLFFGFGLAFWENSSPLWALAAPLHSAGASFSIIERIFWLWPYLFGAPLCGYYLCFRLTRNAYAAALGALPFAINTWSIGLIERGHIPSLDAAMMAGITFPLAMDLTKQPTAKAALQFAAIVSLQTIYDVRYGYESVFVLTFIACLSARKFLTASARKAAFRAACCVIVALVALNLHVVLPVLFVPSAPSGWGARSAFSQVSHYGSLLSSFSAYYPFYRWVIGRDGFVETGTDLPFLVVSLTAWLGLLLTRRRLRSRTLLAIAVLGTILVSETKGPFAGLNAALYAHVPGFFLFRDYTKFFGLIVPTSSAGLALMFVIVSASARLRFGLKRRFAVGILATASIAYLVVVRDAFNPLRQSNFGRAAMPSPQGMLTENYLVQNLGDARVLMLPGDIRFQGRERFVASAGADHFALDPPPLGFAPLNAALDGPESIFTILASPLAPAILNELRVKFIVVPDDRALYDAWDGRPGRWACLDFIRQQPWLHEIAHFGKNVVFTLNAPLGERAFFAPRPALVFGSPATLEGLVASPLWTGRAAALVFAQMPPTADWLSAIPNIAIGPTLIDPDYPIGRSSVGDLSRRLASNLAAERFRERPYSAYVFNSAMLTTSLLQWNLQSTFAYHFKTERPRAAKITFLTEGRHQSPTVLLQNAGETGGYAVTSLQSVSAGPIVCGRAPAEQQPFDASGTPIALSDSAAGKQLFIENSCPTDYRATLSFTVESGDLLPMQFYVTYGNVTREFTAFPAWMSRVGAGNVSLDEIALRPGLNLIQVTKTSPRALSIKNGYTLSSLRATRSSSSLQPLALSVRRSQSGEIVYASIDVPRPGLHVGYIDLFGHLQVPLDRHPLCTIKYSMREVPGSFDFVVNLRNRDSGKLLTLWTPMRQPQDADFDVYQVVGNGLQERFESDLRYHADDPLWTAAHFREGPGSPDDYELESIRIAATWSVLDSSDIPHGTFILLLRGLRLSTATRSLGSAWSLAQSAALSTANIGAKSFILHGMRLLRVASAGGDEARIDAQLVGFTPDGYRLATALHVGDYVELSLQSERRVSGTIIGESSDYVLIRDGVSSAERIARGTIARILEQTVARSAQVNIPLAAAFQPTRLSFNVRNDENLKVRINLTYEAPDGSREIVGAVDREQSERDGIDVEPDFIAPRALVAGTVFDVAVPIDVTLAQISSAQWTNYNLDLWNIERFHFGGLSRRLVGLTLEFAQIQNNEPTIRQYSVAVSALTLSRDRLFEGAAAPSAPREAIAFLDGTALAIEKSSPVAETPQFAVAQESLGILAPGDHVIASRSVERVELRAATVSQGEPAPFLSGSVSEVRSITPSEMRGRISGAGLLVISRTYDPGWSMATWPATDPQPAFSGFALVDWFRSLRHFAPRDYHVPVNTNIDAFYVPPDTAGTREFAMIYTPEALNELGFALTVGIVGCFFVWRLSTLFRRTNFDEG